MDFKILKRFVPDVSRLEVEYVHLEYELHVEYPNFCPNPVSFQVKIVISKLFET